MSSSAQFPLGIAANSRLGAEEPAQPRPRQLLAVDDRDAHAPSSGRTRRVSTPAPGRGSSASPPRPVRAIEARGHRGQAVTGGRDPRRDAARQAEPGDFDEVRLPGLGHD
jgi:hypothetical protein